MSSRGLYENYNVEIISSGGLYRNDIIGSNFEPIGEKQCETQKSIISIDSQSCEQTPC